MKTAVFWNVTPCILVEITDVSEEFPVMNLVDKRRTRTDASNWMMDVLAPAKRWNKCTRLYRGKSRITQHS